MNDVVQSAEDFLKILNKLSPDLFCLVGIVILGYMMRAVPSFPNKVVPFFWLVIGPLVYILMVKPNTDEIPHNIRNIWVYQGLRGEILGAAAWFLHDKVLSHVENYVFTKLPWLEKIFGKVQPATVAKAEEIIDKVKKGDTDFLKKEQEKLEKGKQ